MPRSRSGCPIRGASCTALGLERRRGINDLQAVMVVHDEGRLGVDLLSGHRRGDARPWDGLARRKRLQGELATHPILALVKHRRDLDSCLIKSTIVQDVGEPPHDEIPIVVVNHGKGGRMVKQEIFDPAQFGPEGVSQSGALLFVPHPCRDQSCAASRR
jgi:hypothetical protein